MDYIIVGVIYLLGVFTGVILMALMAIRGTDEYSIEETEEDVEE